MEEPVIQFFSEGINFDLSRQDELRFWLTSVTLQEKKELSFVNYIFCDDEYLLELNRQYLGHDYYTDVISFPYSENDTSVEGDIYISLERVTDNAHTFGIAVEEELHRVIIHGLLHLLGFDDQDAEQKARMSKKEDECLSILPMSRPN